MNLLTLALRHLRRRPGRTGLCVIGIAVAVGVALALVSLTRSVQDGARAGLDEIGGDLIVMSNNAPTLSSGFIPDSTLARIGAVPGVTQISGTLVAFAPSGNAGNVLTFGWSDGSILWKKAPLREGRVPAGGESRVVVLGDAAAAELGKRLNDELDLFGQTFKVIGIAGYASRVDRRLVLVPLADLQELSYRPRQVTIAHVMVADAANRAELARIGEAIQAMGNVVAVPANEMLYYDRNFIVLAAASLAAAVIAAVMSALNVITALTLATRERAREIGIFSAIGWSGGRIMESIMIEGVTLWAIGCALGVVLSLAAAYAVPYIPLVGRLIALRTGLAVIVPVVGGALVLCVLGALLPAWRAARMLPAEALRR
jgi:putative ABC transport system permease protein